MRRWQLLITRFPEGECYNMSPREAWDLPIPQFRWLSDVMEKVIRSRR